MKICTNCNITFKDKELVECPKCNNKLRYESNSLAIVAFIFSMYMPLILLLDGISFGFLADLVFSITYVAPPLGFILGLIAVALKDRYIRKYTVLSIIAVLISFFSCIFLLAILSQANSDLCGNTWCSDLDTTVQMNWKIKSQDSGGL